VGAMQTLSLRRWATASRPVLVMLMGTALALAMGCKKEAAVPEPPGTAPSPTVAGDTTQSMAALKLYAEVPKLLAPRVLSMARQAFSEVEEAQALWPLPEQKALAYYHAIELLGALGRADGLTSTPAVTEIIQEILFEEYDARLYRRSAGEIPVSDKEIEDYYKANLNQYIVKGQFWIRHIFLNVVDNPGKEKEKEALAQQALAEIKAGKPFQEVAKKFSDAEQEKGDVVGPLPYGDINPDLEKAIVALQPGQNTDVLPSKWGYNIFRLEQIVRPTTKTIEMVRDSITQQLRRQKGRAAYQRFHEQMEQQMPVAKHYEVLKKPDATSDTVWAESSFMKITVGDYRKRLAQMPPQKRSALDDPENQTTFLDRWVNWKRTEHAAAEAGLNRDPDLQTMKDYMTNWTLAMTNLDRLGAKLPQPDEGRIRKYYEENRAHFVSKQGEVRLRELILNYRLPDGATKRDYFLARKKALAQAEEILAKLKQGADFVEMVRQYSNSEMAKKEGDLGFIQPMQWGKELAEAVAKMNVGEWTLPLEKAETFTIFRLEERKPEELLPLDEARKRYISEALLGERRSKVSARIQVALAKAYRKAMPVEEIRKIAEALVAEAGKEK